MRTHLTAVLASSRSEALAKRIAALGTRMGAQMKDGEFEFVYHFNNHFNLFFRCMLPSEKRCHSLLSLSVYNNKQKQGFKWLLTVVHFARPNPMQICAYTWIYRWTKQTVENQDWATGPPGLRASGPPGLRAARPSRAVGRGPLGLRAAGPLGRGGPWAAGRWAAGRWAAGLLLAKPGGEVVYKNLVLSTELIM